MQPSPICLCCGGKTLSPWSHVTDREYFTSTDVFDYFRCSACMSLSIHPVPENRLREIYPSNYYSADGGADSFVQKVKLALDRRLFKNVFASLKGQSLSALDVGGGSGWLLSQAQMVDARLKSTMVVDLDPSVEAKAKSNGHRYFCGRIEDFQSEEKFDLILMMNLIEHVKDPVGILKKVGALLKPGGRILLKTPNYDSLDARLFRTSYWGGLHAPRHWVLFTPESFKIAVERSGLKLVRLSLTQGAPFWAASITSLLVDCGIGQGDKKHPLYLHPLFGVFSMIAAAFDYVRKPFMRTSQMFAILSQ